MVFGGESDVFDDCRLGVFEDLRKECREWVDYKDFPIRKNKSKISDYEKNERSLVFESDPEIWIQRIEKKEAGELDEESQRVMLKYANSERRGSEELNEGVKG